jgi:PIN domain nuclease of toxin-antitoxin system
MPAPLLDTHAWLWWIDGSGRLSERVRAALDEYPEEDRPSLAAISLWEMAMLVDLGRVQLRTAFDDWIDIAASPVTVQLRDATASVAKELLRLPESLHREPADRLIVATARVFDLPVLTHDSRIRSSRLVRLWRP